MLLKIVPVYFSLSSGPALVTVDFTASVFLCARYFLNKVRNSWKTLKLYSYTLSEVLCSLVSDYFLMYRVADWGGGGGQSKRQASMEVHK